MASLSNRFAFPCRGINLRMIVTIAVALSFTASCKQISTSERAPATAHTKNQRSAIEQKITDTAANAAEPAIATDEEGNIFVLWVEHATDRSADLVLQKFDREMKPVGDRTRVNSVVGSVRAWAGDPPTINIHNGTVFIGWTRRLQGASGTDYVLSVSPEGRQFSEPVKINDDIEPASHGMHSLAIDTDGTIYAAWLDERNVRNAHAELSDRADEGFRFIKIDHKGPESAHAPEPNSEVFFAYSTDGGKTFSKNEKIAGDSCPCCKTSILPTGNGRLHVSWRQVLDGDYRHIAVASSRDGGKTFSPRVIVSDDRWKLSACPVSGAALSVTDDGTIGALWYTAGDLGQAGYYLAVSKNGGASFEPRVLISSEATSGTPVILGDPSGQIFVVPGLNEQVLIIPTKSGTDGFEAVEPIERAANPSAANAVDGATYVAFVRSDKSGTSVWLARR